MNFTKKNIIFNNVDKIINLRHEVLRKGYPIEEVKFKEDNYPSTRHYAINYEDNIIACLTLLRENWESNDAWRLRAMAVDSKYRGKGAGKYLLKYALNDLKENNISGIIWCHARTSSIGFYENFGFSTYGNIFTFGNAGESIKMIKK